MLVETSWLRALHVMNGGTPRNGLLVVISLMAVLEVIVLLAAMAVGEIDERVAGMINMAFASIGGIAAALLLVLRLESIKATAESVDRKADRAAIAAKRSEQAASVAAQKTAVVEQKTEAVEQTVAALAHDIHNDVVIRKVLAAIKAAENDPELEASRIDRIAKGVQQDRHTTGSREANAYARGAREYRDALIRRGVLPPEDAET